ERDASGALDQGAQPSAQNNFQARYAIRHPWAGEVKCREPRRGVWGGAPGGSMSAAAVPAMNLADAPRGSVDLGSFLGPAAPDAGELTRGYALPALPVQAPAPPHAGCAGCRVGAEEEAKGEGGAPVLLGVLAAAGMVRRRRRGSGGG